jgi:hypothetical protein
MSGSDWVTRGTRLATPNLGVDRESRHTVWGTLRCPELGRLQQELDEDYSVGILSSKWPFTPSLVKLRQQPCGWMMNLSPLFLDDPSP